MLLIITLALLFAGYFNNNFQLTHSLRNHSSDENKLLTMTHLTFLHFQQFFVCLNYVIFQLNILFTTIFGTLNTRHEWSPEFWASLKINNGFNSGRNEEKNNKKTLSLALHEWPQKWKCCVKEACLVTLHLGPFLYSLCYFVIVKTLPGEIDARNIIYSPAKQCPKQSFA